ncbi:5'-methylthioadenosine/S-adenosylhomocysteine nucleosidase family protein [[Mycoplasma] gypis]|uniref:5'-methylthioadenosine/S-adenosylhomocysteine nucleosidase n=1 Tax=[Mycoplasma] gypis TaxID=92404 RepID=A0ABZ2RPY5_9BACT|nr:5'-methylthioadenosine/S-adenosylhomocysteine nucleosidase [[Mycoplasma] gypis]MBN0919612.1 5'-methylthioadenosine/S-adenosylhomocysteine nucleosidase [[Mycoplasma] gypis]
MLFVFAELQECQNILKISNIKERIILNKVQEIYICEYDNVHFFIGISGVGKVNAATFLTYFLSHYEVTDIFNIGTSGALNGQYKIGDIVSVTKGIYWDVDLSVLPGYKKGQLPGLNDYFYALKKPEINTDFSDAKIICGDSFATLSALEKNEFKADLVDMESVALLQTLELLKKEVGFYIFKVISDNLLKKSNQEDYSASTNLCAERIEQLFIKLIKNQ